MFWPVKGKESDGWDDLIKNDFWILEDAFWNDSSNDFFLFCL